MKYFRLGGPELLLVSVGLGFLAEQELVRVVTDLLGEPTNPNGFISGIGFVCLLIGSGVFLTRNMRVNSLKIGPLELTLAQKKEDAATLLSRQEEDAATLLKRQEEASE
jgi:hypothetical protein